MNNGFSNIVIFCFGASIGSVATWQYAKKKYEQRIYNEIASVKEVLSQRPTSNQKEEPTAASKQAAEEAKTNINLAIGPSTDISKYISKMREPNYVNYATLDSLNQDKFHEEEERETVDMPYVISPDDFGEFEDYEKISLTYYSDNILADDNDELVENVEDVVGFESLNTFGDYEDDSTFVRNNKLKCDYEILLDRRKFSDVVKEKPHGVED